MHFIIAFWFRHRNFLDKCNRKVWGQTWLLLLSCWLHWSIGRQCNQYAVYICPSEAHYKPFFLFASWGVDFRSSHMKNPFVQPSALLHVYGRSPNTAHMKILFCRTACWPQCTWSCAIWCIELDAGFYRLPYHITKQQQTSASAWCYNFKSPFSQASFVFEWGV
jgi:hypothetical protein